MAGEDAFGTQLWFSNMETPTPTYTMVASVTDINGPDRTREALDVTAHDSDEHYMEFIPGLKDGGEVTLTLNFRPGQASHLALDDQYDLQEVLDYRLVVLPADPDEITWDFPGFITDLGDAYPHDDKMERSVTFKVAGKPVLTESGS